MKMSRKKFVVSLGAAVAAGAMILSNPIKLFATKKAVSRKISVKENPDAVKRNSTGALHG